MGGGGGVFLVPAMALLLGVPQQEAQGISLAVVVPTSIIGAYTHYGKGNVSTSLVPLLTVPAVLLAIVASFIAHALPAAMLKQAFGVLLVLVGAQMTLTKARKAEAAPRKAQA
jgi:hypothetical protein